MRKLLSLFLPVVFAGLVAVPQAPCQSEDTMPAQQYELQLLSKTTCRATLGDEVLELEVGFSNYEIRVDELQYVYFSDRPGGFQQLVFNYGIRLTFDVNRDDEATAELLEALRERRPDIEIEKKTPEEIRRIVEGVNIKAFLPYPAAILLTALVAFFFIPSFIHGRDSGHLTLDVAELSAPGFESETRNLTVRGRPLLDMAMVHTVETRNTKGFETVFPLVPANWQPGDPVAVFARTGMIDDTTYATLADAREISGVLRNIWWEGLSRKNQAFFRDEMGLELVEHVSVIDFNTNRKLGMYIGIPVVLLVAAFAVFLAQAFHNKLSGF